MPTSNSFENTATLPENDTEPVAPVEKSPDSAGPTDERTVHILRLLEKGVLTDSTRFLAQERELKSALRQAQAFGTHSGSPEEWSQLWRQRWNQVEGLLRFISDLNCQMHERLCSTDPAEVQRAVTCWDSIKSEDERLSSALEHLRTQASDLDSEAQKSWNTLATTLEQQIETIQSCSHALGLKLELMQRHSKAEIDQMLNDLAAQLPKNTATNQAARDAITYAEDYDNTVAELKREQHESLGMIDVVKNMFMWTESPHERLNRKRSLRTD